MKTQTDRPFIAPICTMLLFADLFTFPFDLIAFASKVFLSTYAQNCYVVTLCDVCKGSHLKSKSIGGKTSRLLEAVEVYFIL